MSCCDHEFEIINYGLESGAFGLFLTLFMTGLVSSFTHCIGMCGPIAIGQMSIRLMHLPTNEVSQINKLFCALATPYYIGKAMSYALLAVVCYSLSVLAMDNPIAKFFGAVLMSAAAIFFVGSAFIKTSKFPAKWHNTSIIRTISIKLSNISGTLASHPFGWQGWLLGTMLGFIPCGIVYASIATALAYSNNAIVAGLSLFIFGLGTIPGLFLTAYLGKHLLIKWRNIFDILYTVSMLYNAYLLISAAIKYVSSI